MIARPEPMDAPKNRAIPPGTGRAFTMVEMLLVVAVLSVITLALYRSISNGLRVWDRVYRFSVEEDVAIFMDRLTTDLRNLTMYSRFPFQGQTTRMVIPTLVRVPADRKSHEGSDEIVEQLGSVEYYFDGLRSSIYRKQGNYGQTVRRRSGPAGRLAQPVQSLKFFYLKIEHQNIVEYPALDQVPLAVRVEVEFQDQRGVPHKVSRLIHVPLNENFAKDG